MEAKKPYTGMKNLTQQQKLQIVTASPEDSPMYQTYANRLQEDKMQWSRNNCRIKGKKTGMYKFINAQKAIAARVYDDFISGKLQQPAKQGKQLSLPT